MTSGRTLSPTEVEAQRIAKVMAYQAQGYSILETARMLGVSQSTVRRDIKRVEKRVPAEEAKQWRQVQLLRYERLYSACEAVLTAHHVVVSNGQIVQQFAKDDEGKPIWDVVYGPDGEPLTDDKGNIRVEQRRVPLEDHAAVLETVAEMRKLEVEMAKLLGTQVATKATVDVQQHVDYTINGTDMSKVLGLDRGQG